MTLARAIPALDSTFGYIFLAGIISTALWGGAFVQLYFYYEEYYRKDKWWLKLYLAVIWMLDTARQAILIQALYVYFVREFANLLFVTHRPKSGLVNQTIFGAIVNAMVQSIYITRVWSLSNGNYFLTGILLIVVLGLLGASLTYFAQTYGIAQAAELKSAMTAARAMNSLVVVSDTLIALALMYLLWKRRSGVRKTDSIVKRLVVYTVGTGLVTGISGTVGVVGASVLPDTYLYLFIDIVIPKLYLNCLLASLNSRTTLRENLGDAGCVSIHLSDMRPGPSNRSRLVDAERQMAPRQIEVKVDVDTLRDAQPSDKTQWE